MSREVVIASACRTAIGKFQGGLSGLTAPQLGAVCIREAIQRAGIQPDARVFQEEIFGPVVSVIPCDGLDQAIEIGNGVVYGLSSSIYTRDVNNAFRAMRDMETGIFYVNAPTIGAETHLPFGGTKQTGNGHREAAIAALDFYSEWKAIYIDYSDKLQRAQIDT